MIDLTVTIDNAEINQRLGDLALKLEDLSPVMRPIAAELLSGMKQAFVDEADPKTGTPWQRLADSTIKQRTKLGYWPGKKLQRTGRLVSSLVSDSGPTFAIAGTNLVYATTQNFGANKGQFGTTKHGSPVPWGDIPPRRFAEISPATTSTVLDLIYQFLT